MTTTAAAVVKHLITLPVGKGALAWTVPDGTHITEGATVATFAGRTVSAPASGKLYRVTPDGTTMSGGVPIGRVHEGETGTAYKPLESSVRAAAEISHNTALTATEPQARQMVQPVEPIREAHQPRRRGTVAPPSEPVVTVLEAGAPVVAKGKGKKRTKHAVYHVTEEQAGRIASLSFLFKSDPEAPNYSESEIVRAAVEHLLSQDRPTIEAILSHNRGREKSAGYGAGWRRPGKVKR